MSSFLHRFVWQPTRTSPLACTATTSCILRCVLVVLCLCSHLHVLCVQVFMPPGSVLVEFFPKGADGSTHSSVSCCVSLSHSGFLFRAAVDSQQYGPNRMPWSNYGAYTRMLKSQHWTWMNEDPSIESGPRPTDFGGAWREHSMALPPDRLRE